MKVFDEYPLAKQALDEVGSLFLQQTETFPRLREAFTSQTALILRAFDIIDTLSGAHRVLKQAMMVNVVLNNFPVAIPDETIAERYRNIVLTIRDYAMEGERYALPWAQLTAATAIAEMEWATAALRDGTIPDNARRDFFTAHLAAPRLEKMFLLSLTPDMEKLYFMTRDAFLKEGEESWLDGFKRMHFSGQNIVEPRISKFPKNM